MKKVKTYREIKSVEMDNDHVYAVYFKKKEGVLYPEEIFRTKDEVLKDAEHVRASGYGTYSGRKVWQMPQKITRQIRQLLGDKYTCVYDDSWE
jgi:hypothetical protein